MRHEFPEGFLWGAATAAYQIEGAVDQDGRAPANWDVFARLPGRTRNGESGMVACDHYNRYREDVALMKQIGLKAYRFSIAWPRVLPEGSGTVNERGLDFYNRLVDELLENGIKPVATCFHWDMPYSLEKKHNGWTSRDLADVFAEYCGLLAERLGDRVKMWATINEPEVVLHAGHKAGVHAPGLKLGPQEYRQASHHLLLAHGKALQAMRDSGPSDLRIGIVHNSASVSPLTESEEDISAARQEFYRRNAWIVEPLLKGTYPQELWKEEEPDVPEVRDGDLELIGAPIDFFGINVYFSGLCVSKRYGAREYEEWFPRTQMTWPITPDALYWTVRFNSELFRDCDMYITENGCACPDQVKDINGEAVVEDYARVQFLREYLKGVHRATEEGLPLRGYFVWSLMDNFEWAGGYKYRFGIVHVNYETLERTLKESGKYYSRIIANNGF